MTGKKELRLNLQQNWLLVLLACSAALGLLAWSKWSRPASSPHAAALPAPAPVVVLAAPGRTEGLSEMVNVGSAIDGVLSAVFVREGQHVKAGQLIALVERRDLEAELASERAAAESSRQIRVRLLRGSRDEERRQAAAEAARAQAVLEESKTHYQRMARLFESDNISRQTYDKARADFEIAQAALCSAVEREKLVNAGPLPEEVARADSDIRTAEERIRTIQANLDKCRIHAPLSGTVLRCHLKAGEVVSTFFPQPIVSIMDTSRLRIRAEVDERDLGRIHVGQRALVLADAFPQNKMAGTVARLGSLMGRKKVHTGDPAEKSDRDVLEVLVDLNERDPRLVVGLRVTVQFLDMSAQHRQDSPDSHICVTPVLRTADVLPPRCDWSVARVHSKLTEWE